MIIAGVDIETTGFDHNDDRIVEIAIVLHKDDRQPALRYVKRVHPQRSISPGAQRVHGISIPDLVDCPPWEETGHTVSKILDKADLLVGHNGDKFDVPFIIAQLMRVGAAMPSFHTFDTMLEGRWATFNGKYPKLGELCFALDVAYEPEKAHSALYDVDVMMECFYRGLDRGSFTLPSIGATE